MASLLISGAATISYASSGFAQAAKPQTKIDDVQFADPYRWLEKDSQERVTWIREQNRYSKEYLNNRKSRAQLEGLFKEMFDQARSGFRFEQDGFSYWIERGGLGRPTQLMQKSVDGTLKALFDSQEEKKNGSVAVVDYELSPDRKYFVVSTVASGSTDYYTIHVIKLASGERVARIENTVSSSLTWFSPDEVAYAYRIGGKDLSFKRKLESPQAQESLMAKEEIYHVNKTINDELWVLQFDREAGRLRKVTDETWYNVDSDVSETVALIGDDLYFKSDGERRTGQLARLKLEAAPGSIAKPEVVIPEGPMELQFVEYQDNHFVAVYKMAATFKIVITDRSGTQVRSLVTPSCCSVTSVAYTHGLGTIIIDFDSQVSSMSFTYDFNSKTYQEGDPAQKLLERDGHAFVSEIVNVTSANSTQVPVRLTYKKGLSFNGENPALIQGYGGFGNAVYFDPYPEKMVYEFMKRGGVYVAPALRGGSELGEPWHKDGKGAKKQNVFNDLIATAEYVIDRGITSPSRLAVMGASNGGRLVSAVATQRPDLFRLAIPIAGVHDMMRKERLDPDFNEGWSHEYGNTDNVEEFKTLLSYSPLHNLRKQAYPAFLVVVGEQDSRVNPAHSYKITAALQNAQTGPGPILMTSIKNAGHFMTSGQRQGWIAWRSNVSIWSMIFDELGVPP